MISRFRDFFSFSHRWYYEEIVPISIKTSFDDYIMDEKSSWRKMTRVIRLLFWIYICVKVFHKSVVSLLGSFYVDVGNTSVKDDKVKCLYYHMLGGWGMVIKVGVHKLTQMWLILSIVIDGVCVGGSPLRFQWRDWIFYKDSIERLNPQWWPSDRHTVSHHVARDEVCEWTPGTNCLQGGGKSTQWHYIRASSTL